MTPTPPRHPTWVLIVALGTSLGTSACHPAPEPPAATAEAAEGPPLMPADAGFELANAVARNPETAELPGDTMLARHIRLGYEIFRDTKKMLPDNVGNELACTSCHLNAGQREGGLPLVGIAGLFPISRGREQRLFSLEDRIRGCFLRSMNGTPPDFDSEGLLALSAYITWLSMGQRVGEAPPWRGTNRIHPDSLVAIASLDPARGKALFLEKCSACHQEDGQGVAILVPRPGPLWGPQSWNDGAGMARVYTAAGFIRYAMPMTAPGSLSDEEAQQIAAYINSQDRPAYPNKAEDFPNGAPADAVYYPRYPKNPLRK